ncbi:hypothetical protein F4818DRAFT_292592 [Hypoxylon cercidicola]|nr:hypothetical protein F4818DRAFT_292592 [Hypoxylon cercidicola]
MDVASLLSDSKSAYPSTPTPTSASVSPTFGTPIRERTPVRYPASSPMPLERPTTRWSPTNSQRYYSSANSQNKLRLLDVNGNMIPASLDTESVLADTALSNGRDAMAKDIRPIPSQQGLLAPLDFTKVHKRTFSAPTFATTSAINPHFDHMSHSSYHPSQSPYQSSSHPSSSHQSSPPQSSRYPLLPSWNEPSPSYEMEESSSTVDLSSLPSEPNKDGICCMFVPNCDTGSQPRKAISHIFGRNKTCTRCIPPEVWVHFCRKHYQRSRYRNAHEWARIQCDLVLIQINQVQRWSDKNREAGKGPIVHNWSLSMRKRELNRVQEKAQRQRSHRNVNDEEEEEEDAQDTATLNGTAVPQWLRDKCGEGYDTPEILEIVRELQDEVATKKLSQIPDIEILPNITTDAADSTVSRAVLKRKPSHIASNSPGTSPSNSNIHRRSQSVGVTLHPESQDRRVSQPMRWPIDPLPPADKRPRLPDTAMRPTLTPLRALRDLPYRHVGNSRESYYDTEAPGAPSRSYGQTHGQNHGQSHIQSQNHGHGRSQSQSQSYGQGHGHGRSHGQSHGHSHSHSHGHGQSHSPWTAPSSTATESSHHQPIPGVDKYYDFSFRQAIPMAGYPTPETWPEQRKV